MVDFLYEKISYLRGLADGLEVKDDTKEGKLFFALMEVIEEMADSINDLAEDQDELNEYVDLLDEDLSVVEEELFGDLELSEDYYDDDDYDFDFDDEDDDYDGEFDDDFDDDVHAAGSTEMED